MNILGNVVDAMLELLVKLASHLPPSPFNYNEFMITLSDVLGHLNWFIPFYLFKDILSVWVGVLIFTWQVLLVIRWVKSSLL